MSNTLVFHALTLSLIALFNSPVIAQNARTIASTVAPSEEQTATSRVSDEQQARDWGLHTEEWARYRQLMQGPLGIFSPNLDPLTALGIEARSEEERDRYAELQVQVEARRVEKTLAYQRAYDAAWQRLHPSMQRVTLPGHTLGNSANSTDRIAVFIKDGCAPCGLAVQQLQASDVGFDLYMVGSRANDTLIRDWAKRASINPDRVRNGSITLNHDAGRWLILGLPGDNGQWQRQ